MTNTRIRYFKSNAYRKKLKLGDEVITLYPVMYAPPSKGTITSINDEVIVIDWRGDNNLLNLSLSGPEDHDSRQLTLRVCDLSDEESSELVTQRLQSL